MASRTSFPEVTNVTNYLWVFIMCMRKTDILCFHACIWVYMCTCVYLSLKEREWQWGVSRPPGYWHSARSQDRGGARNTSCTCRKPLQTQKTGIKHHTQPHPKRADVLSWLIILNHSKMSDTLLCFCSTSPTTVATSWQSGTKRGRTGRCSRGICVTVLNPSNPLTTSATRRTAVRKRQELKSAKTDTRAELAGPEGGLQ